MEQLLQHLLNGLVLGGTYALLGIGLTLLLVGLSFPVLPGADRSGQSRASSIDCPILAPDRRILVMSASVMGR